MKKVYLCLLAGASLALASCSSDDLTAVGGGSDTTGGGSTSTVTPVSTPSVPLDNWKKARVVLNSPANTLVSLSYSTAEESETPIIDNYVVSEGTNNIDFTVPTYVDEVKVTYTSNGSEASTTAVLSNVTFEKEFVYDKNDGWYTTSNDPSTLGRETMRNEVVVKIASGAGCYWHEHWTYYSANNTWNLQIHYAPCEEVNNDSEKVFKIENPGYEVEEAGEEIQFGEIDLTGDLTNLPDGLLETDYRNEGTTFHSSGVVMFDAYWPTSGIFDEFQYPHDMNDVVIDYNLESVYIDHKPGVNDEYFAQNDWKEGLTVTMHVRAVGSYYPQKVGLKLEGLSMDFVKSHYEEMFFAAGQGKQEPIPGDANLNVEVKEDGGCPVIWISGLQYFNSDAWRNCKYVNDDIKGLDVRYNAERKNKLYWLSTGEDYINRGGPLFTVKVKFEGEPRAALVGDGMGLFENPESMAKANEQVEAFKGAAKNSAQQNFFIVTGNDDGNTYEIHVGGYAPLESYKATYESVVKDNPALQIQKDDKTIYYVGADNGVWGVKAPMLVKHIYQGESFVNTYKDLKGYLESWGEKNRNWFNPSEADCDDTNLVKYW